MKKKKKGEKEEKKRPIDTRMPIEVIYCGVCSRPPEYCPLSADPNQCKVWLFKNSPALYAKIFGGEAPKIEEVKKETEEDKANGM